MELDVGGPADDPELLAPPDWTMDFYREGNLYTADLKRSMLTMCRVSIVTSIDNEAAARTTLTRKARLWIRDYLARSQPE
jgi:hypothetical protein